MAKRCDLEIKADLLYHAIEGARISRLVYRCNLNFKIIAPYLEELLKLGLLTMEGKAYKTTEEGRKALEIYETVMGVFRAPLTKNVLGGLCR